MNRILLHHTCILSEAGTLRAFQNRWQHMPSETRIRFEHINRGHLRRLLTSRSKVGSAALNHGMGVRIPRGEPSLFTEAQVMG